MPDVEPASFRDPDATVFVQEGRVFRGLSDRSARSYRAATDIGLIGDLVERGWLIDHWEAETSGNRPSRSPNQPHTGSPSRAGGELPVRVELHDAPGCCPFDFERHRSLLPGRVPDERCYCLQRCLRRWPAGDDRYHIYRGGLRRGLDRLRPVLRSLPGSAAVGRPPVCSLSAVCAWTIGRYTGDRAGRDVSRPEAISSAACFHTSIFAARSRLVPETWQPKIG